MGVDGHEMMCLGTIFSSLLLTHRILPSGWMKSMIHRYPTLAFPCFLSAVGLALPMIIPPIRKAMNLPNTQYYKEEPKVDYPQLSSSMKKLYEQPTTTTTTTTTTVASK